MLGTTTSAATVRVPRSKVREVQFPPAQQPPSIKVLQGRIANSGAVSRGPMANVAKAQRHST